MGKYFDDIHACCEAELANLPHGLVDSTEVAAARLRTDYEGYLALGESLSRQIRYREAAEAYSLAVAERADSLEAYRLRAGRYLSSMQLDRAYADFLKCAELGADKLDLEYRLGLCCYYMARYSEAMDHFNNCLALADDEMRVAAIYWHTLSAYRLDANSSALTVYHVGMEVGHHFAYEKAVMVCAGTQPVEDALLWLTEQTDDLHYAITAYGLSVYLEQNKRSQESTILRDTLLKRNDFWPCYAYLAAWNDKRKENNARK